MQTTKDFLKNEDCVEICILLRLLPFILKKTFMRISELFGRSQILLLWTLLKPKVSVLSRPWNCTYDSFCGDLVSWD